LEQQILSTYEGWTHSKKMKDPNGLVMVPDLIRELSVKLSNATRALLMNMIYSKGI
jgi:hypothetical protein